MGDRDGLGAVARRDLLDARDEHAYHLRQARQYGMRCCDDAIDDLISATNAARADFLRVAWAAKARGATAREIAEVLSVTTRTVERYWSEFRARLGDGS